jgi:hypothetical protein
LHFAPGLSLILLGCTGVTTGLFAARRVLQQGDWLRIPGRVESGAIVGTGETYTARVVYNYTVDGVQLTGNVVKPGAVEYNWRGPAERVIRRNPPGSDVVVFVDPRNVGDAVLEPGGSNLHPVFMAVSAIALIVGVLVLLT